MDKLVTLLPGYAGKPMLFNKRTKGLTKSQVYYSKASQLKEHYGLVGADIEFICYAMYNLPESLVTKAAVAARELGKKPGAYFNAIIRNEIAARKGGSS